MLSGIIPAHRLRDSFDRAFLDHNSSFPVNAYDLKASWAKIQAEEATLREEEIAADKAANPIKYCTEPDRHVDADGNVDVLLGGLGGTEVIVPCPICRPQAHQQRMLDLRSTLKIDHPVTEQEMENKVVQMFVEAKASKQSPEDNTDPMKIIGRLMRELGVAVTDARSERKRDYFHRGYIRLGQIADRIRSQEA